MWPSPLARRRASAVAAAAEVGCYFLWLIVSLDVCLCTEAQSVDIFSPTLLLQQLFSIFCTPSPFFSFSFSQAVVAARAVVADAAVAKALAAARTMPVLRVRLQLPPRRPLRLQRKAVPLRLPREPLAKRALAVAVVAVVAVRAVAAVAVAAARVAAVARVVAVARAVAAVSSADVARAAAVAASRPTSRARRTSPPCAKDAGGFQSSLFFAGAIAPRHWRQGALAPCPPFPFCRGLAVGARTC